MTSLKQKQPPLETQTENNPGPQVAGETTCQHKAKQACLPQGEGGVISLSSSQLNRKCNTQHPHHCLHRLALLLSMDFTYTHTYSHTHEFHIHRHNEQQVRSYCTWPHTSCPLLPSQPWSGYPKSHLRLGRVLAQRVSDLSHPWPPPVFFCYVWAQVGCQAEILFLRQTHTYTHVHIHRGRHALIPPVIQTKDTQTQWRHNMRGTTCSCTKQNLSSPTLA